MVLPPASPLAARPTPAIAIPFLPDAIVAGDPAAWGEAGLRIGTWTEDGTSPISPLAFSAEARLAWTRQGIAVRMRLRSRVAWRETAEARLAFGADSLELFVRAGASTVQAVISPGMAPDQDHARSAIWDYRGERSAWADAPTGVTVSRTRDPGGCTIVVVMPTSQVRVDCVHGASIEVKLQVNKHLPGEGRRQWSWRDSGGGDFHHLSLASEMASDVVGGTVDAVTSAAWAVLDGYDRVVVHAVGPIAWAGRTAAIRQSGAVLASATFAAESVSGAAADRALMSCHLPASALGAPGQALTIELDGAVLGTSRLPDPRLQARLALEGSTLRPFRLPQPGDVDPLVRIRPRVPVVLRPGRLPAASAPDPVALMLAGMTSMRTRWFTSDGAETTAAATPGRYGAVITLTMSDGVDLGFHQTTVVLGDETHAGATVIDLAASARADAQVLRIRRMLGDALDGSGVVDREAALLAVAAGESARDGAPLRPYAREQAWWHAQRRRLGTATRYPRFKLLPPTYEREPAQLWPAIIYLHGSGGNLPRDYTPFAKRSTATDLIAWATGRALPFAIYALQTDRGWEPDAVLDAVDELLAEDRLDPDRICIMGFSMGGIGTWDCAVDYPRRWSCAVPLGGCGYRSDEASRVTDLPVWSFKGDNDSSTTLSEAQTMIDAMRAAGGKPRFTVLEGADHGRTQHGAFETAGLWEWIAGQRRAHLR